MRGSFLRGLPERKGDPRAKEKEERTQSDLKDESKLDEVKSDVPLPTQTLNKKSKTGKRHRKQQGRSRGRKAKRKESMLKVHREMARGIAI